MGVFLQSYYIISNLYNVKKIIVRLIVVLCNFIKCLRNLLTKVIFTNKY